jgi:hypothetical protein
MEGASFKLAIRGTIKVIERATNKRVASVLRPLSVTQNDSQENQGICGDAYHDACNTHEAYKLIEI